MSYERLLSPGRIGKMKLKNRVVMTAMETDLCNSQGQITDEVIAYYEARAKGGVGLIITEACTIDEVHGRSFVNSMLLTSRAQLRGLEELCEAVHRHDSKIIFQIYHGGNQCNPALSGNQNISASNVGSCFQIYQYDKKCNPIAIHIGDNPALQPRPMTIEEIHDMEDKFVSAALLCKAAGADGVEIHAAHGYLIAQFLSRYFNHRTDEYGGCMENRVRFLREIIEKVRAAVGRDFIVSVRISGDETLTWPAEPAVPTEHQTLDETLEIVKMLDALQMLDVINVSNGGAISPLPCSEPYSYPKDWKKHVAKAVHEVVSVPVIATNNIKNPDWAESLLEENVCDYIGIGRANLADAEWIRKTESGHVDEIRQCIGCMSCQENVLNLGSPMRCTVNPVTGREHLYPSIAKDGDGRSVVVVGAGPAGMEAARILALRGFDVTLFEKKERVGGTLNVAKLPPYKDKIGSLVHSMECQLKAAGVKICCNTEATEGIVKKLNPVGIFIASGAAPIRPSIPGLDQNNVYLAEDVLATQKELPGKVAVIGTGLTGLETAEALANRGSTLALVEMMPGVGPGLYPIILHDVMRRLIPYAPTLYAGHRLESVEGTTLTLTKLDEQIKVEIEADHIVLAMGVSPVQGVAEQFSGIAPVIELGDAAKAGRIYNALKDGFSKAYAFQPVENR